MISLTEKIKEILAQKFEEEEFNHLFVIDIKQLPGDNIKVFLDSDNAVLFEHCVRISRFLEAIIEENNWLGEQYTLDVSSAGIDAPLRFKRQYAKNIGREVSIDVKDSHKNIKGTLAAVNEDAIVVEREEKVRMEGRKKKKWMTIQQEVAFDNINKTIVKVSF